MLLSFALPFRARKRSTEYSEFPISWAFYKPTPLVLKEGPSSGEVRWSQNRDGDELTSFYIAVRIYAEQLAVSLWLLKSTEMGVAFINFLLVVICLQFLGILHLMSTKNTIVDTYEVRPSPMQSISTVGSRSVPSQTTNATTALDGVAAVLLLHAPNWFQRRYSVMVQNVLNNLPAGENWTVQIFYVREGQSLAGIQSNRGLGRMVASGKVILTPIPADISARYKKRVHLMQSAWLWQNMLAEKVFVFGGNAVVCSNSRRTLKDFKDFAYIGSPWGSFGGVGGDGGISIRSRQLMLNVISFEENSRGSGSGSSIGSAPPEGQEDHFFVSRIEKMRKAGIIASDSYRIATRNDTLKFSAIGSYANDDVLVASGTLPGLSDAEREKFTQFCPEIKVLYPSITSPFCFGAKVDAEKCALSICATRKGPGYHGSC
jgi:hypothetical protein